MADGTVLSGAGFTVADAPKDKVRLLIRPADPDVTVGALRDALAASNRLYERGLPVRLAHDHQQEGMVAHPMTPEGVIREAHGCCRPYVMRERKESMVEVDAPLPKGVALMYLDMRGEWGLPPLNGVASAPLLDEAGGIRAHQGYDPKTGMWCERVPPGLDAMVPIVPTKAEARAALLVLRRLLRTFAFARAIQF